MQEKRHNDAKKEIRSVLLTYPRGVSLDEFLKSYRNLLGVRVPSRTLGYNTDIDLLQSMPDVVHISTNDIGKVILTGIADESSEHIKKLVSKQRVPKLNNKSNNRVIRSRPPNTPFNVRESHPFVPGAIRAEILELAAMYPQGITVAAFVLAYRKKFNKYLPLEKGLVTLECMINTISELEIRTVKNEKKIHYKSIQIGSASNEVFESQKMSPLQTKDVKSQFVGTANNSSNIHKSGISETVRRNFQMLLDKCPEGILAIHFPPLYENVTGQSFDLHELGYSSILELIDALPSLFKRTLDPCNDNNWVIFPANIPVKYLKSAKINLSSTENMPVSNRKKPPLKFREGIPADAASPLLQYMPPKIPEDVNLDEYLPVFVSAIINPEMFWFQLQTDQAIEELDILEKELGSFYDNYASCKYQMHDADIAIGATCVVLCPDDRQWYRAVIKSIPNVDQVNVFFVDYGSRENISRKMLRYVRGKYLDYPAHAFQAQLAGMKLPMDVSSWNINAQHRFIQLCESASLMAYLKPIDSEIFSAYLCDTSSDVDIHINDTLIKEGFAEYAFENQFNRNGFSNKFEEPVTSNGFNSTAEDCLSVKSSCNSVPSSIDNPPLCDSKKCIEDEPLQTNNDNVWTKAGTLPVNRKLSFSVEKKFEKGESKISPVSKEQYSKRYVKLLKLCENKKLHIININSKPYVTAGDLSKLFWSDKDPSYLSERLQYKEVDVPTVKISKDDNRDVFKQCKWYKIPDIKIFESNNNSLTLYPLDRAFEILNIFGHPSICLRLAMQNEIRSFDPNDAIWKEFCYEKSQDLDDIEKEIEKLSKLCMYDLKAKYEALKIKRLKLLKIDSNSSKKEIKRIEHLQFLIEKRIKDIDSICSQYSSCS